MWSIIYDKLNKGNYIMYFRRSYRLRFLKKVRQRSTFLINNAWFSISKYAIIHAFDQTEITNEHVLLKKMDKKPKIDHLPLSP